MTDSTYTLERLSEQNIHHVPPLFMEVFKKRLTIEVVRKKYNTLYTGMEAVGVIAFDSFGKPIAFQGYIPYRFRFQNQEESAVQSCDSLVVKNFRGKNLFTDILQFGMDIAYGAGARFVFGFGNQNSTPIVVKQGWTPMDTMRRYVIPTGGIPLSRGVAQLRLESVFQKHIARLLKPYAAEYANEFIAVDSSALHPIYDRSYIQYKSFNPTHFIKIGDSALFIKADTFIHVGLIKAPSAAAMSTVIDKLSKIARLSGIANILFQLPENAPEEIMLREKYTSAKSWTVCFRQHNSEFDLNKMVLNFSDIDTF